MADGPDGSGLIGACWTKVHRDRTPVLGEIYVIDVDPRHHGQGWGRSLTVAGLVHLAGRGITVGMLYTDASNVAAVSLYRSLGFTVDHIDRSYRRARPDRLTCSTRSTRSTGPGRRPDSQRPGPVRPHSARLAQLIPVPIALPTPKVTPAATAVTPN